MAHVQDIPEELVARLWQRRRSLTTSQGRHMRVLYPGRRSANAGPDFRDAVLVNDAGEILHGDVEVHVQPQGWEAHGHHRDPRYDGVVLHVVWRAGAAPTAVRRDGVGVPVAVIGVEDAAAEETPVPMPGAKALGRLDAKALGVLLDRMGDQRFLERSAGYGESMDTACPEEVLYQALLGALGYSQNREPMQALAQRLPLRLLRSVALAYPAQERQEALAGLLLGSAGLLPSQGGPLASAYGLAVGYFSRAETAYHAVGLGATMSRKDWCLFRVRPSNHPARRILGAAGLVHRYLDQGLPAGLKALVLEEHPSLLAKGLEVRDGVSSCVFVGGARAGDIAVNVVLPFLHAWSLRTGDSSAQEACLRLYAAYPRLQENQVTQEMEAQVLGGRKGAGLPALPARRQQGLMHLYRVLTSARQLEG